MNVFKEMALSVYSYGSYSKFLRNKKGKVFGFGVLLMTIYFLIKMVLPSFTPGSFLDVVESFQENIPDFSLEDGTLWVDDVWEADSTTSYVYINTSPGIDLEDTSEVRESFRRYRSVMLMDSKKIIMKNDGEWQKLYFSELGVEFDKDDLAEFLPRLYVFCVIFYIVFLIVAYIFMTAFFFLGVLFVALIGLLIASCMNYRISFGKLYLLAIYSRTLPLLIKALVSFLPFGIPFFWVLNFGLSAFILAMALMKMKEQMPQNPQNFQGPQNPQGPIGYPPTGGMS